MSWDFFLYLIMERDLKNLPLKEIAPAFTYTLVKVPEKAFTSASGIELGKTKDTMIEAYIADGFPMEVIAVGPQVQSYKTGDHVMFSNLSYPAKVKNVKDHKEVWMCRETDIALVVKKKKASSKVVK